MAMSASDFDPVGDFCVSSGMVSHRGKRYLKGAIEMSQPYDISLHDLYSIDDLAKLPSVLREARKNIGPVSEAYAMLPIPLSGHIKEHPRIVVLKDKPINLPQYVDQNFEGSAASKYKKVLEQPDLFPPNPLQDSEKCSVCATTFGVLRTRYHCRECGLSVCNTCSPRRIPLYHRAIVEPARCCNACCQIDGHELSVDLSSIVVKGSELDRISAAFWEEAASLRSIDLGNLLGIVPSSEADGNMLRVEVIYYLEKQNIHHPRVNMVTLQFRDVKIRTLWCRALKGITGIPNAWSNKLKPLFRQIKNPTEQSDQPPCRFRGDSKQMMRFIPLSVLKQNRSFPKCFSKDISMFMTLTVDPWPSLQVEAQEYLRVPKNKSGSDKTDSTEYTSKPFDFDRANSFVIYVSHSWVERQVKGEQFSVQPDTPDNEKFSLVIEAVESIRRQHTNVAEENVLIWIDYCCVDQKSPTSGISELHNLLRIFEICDAVVTPVVDDGSWTPPLVFADLYTQYQAQSWSGKSERSYLRRMWCRLEMIYASNAPFLDGWNDGRLKGASALMQHFYSMKNKRPHFLYGQREQRTVGSLPHLLPLCKRDDWSDPRSRLCPLSGSFSSDVDKLVVRRLLSDIKFVSHVNSLVSAKLLDEKGFAHGKNRVVTKEGDEYDGLWRHGKRWGEGRQVFSNGDIYEGTFENDVPSGEGTYKFFNGNKYEGAWVNGVQHGSGEFVWASGKSYRGDWVEGKQHGNGVLSGVGVGGTLTKYEGMFVDGTESGKGTLWTKPAANMEADWEEAYCGQWLLGSFHGLGRFRTGEDKPGEAYFYIGQFKNGIRDGKGEFLDKEGNVLYDGEYVGGKWRTNDKKESS